jgi:septal ring factor EnvC (AmiA/AmiB activator)
MYEAIGVKNINAILPAPATPMPMDPSMEHIQALAMKPFQAFPGQDHRAHIEAHLNFMQVNMVRNAPMVMGAIQKNILEHIAIMAQEQVQLEFQQELLEVQQLQQVAMQDPMVAQQIKASLEKIEGRKATLIAEMTAEFAKEENKITSQLDGDPLLKLKSREVDLRAMENERKEREGKQRIDLDRMRAMMNKDTQEEKLEQNEKLAKLRAGVSLAKSGAGNTVIGIED